MNPLGFASNFFPILEKLGLFEIERYKSIFESTPFSLSLFTVELGICPESSFPVCDGSPINTKIPENPMVMQFSTNSEISMNNLADEIIKQINPVAKIVIDNSRIRPKKSEVFRLFGSNTKIINNTNWKLQHTFEDGIKQTIEWFRDSNNISRYKHDIYNI